MRSFGQWPRLCAVFAALVVTMAGCAAHSGSPPPAPAVDMSRAPMSIRTGDADIVVQPVEAGVSDDEVLSAVQRIVAASPICMSWPSLWVDDSESHRAVRVRYDLMRRDWGPGVGDDAQKRMSDFVDMGFLTARARDDIAPSVVDYVFTDRGRLYLSGSPFGGTPPKFCAPSERHVVAVMQTERGQFRCGNLKVHFTFTASDHPSWAQSDAGRMLAAQAANPPAGGAGVVTLSRPWFSADQLPQGSANGSLQSVCFDAHNRIVGNDLTLTAGGS